MLTFTLELVLLLFIRINLLNSFCVPVTHDIILNQYKPDICILENVSSYIKKGKYQTLK